MEPGLQARQKDPSLPEMIDRYEILQKLAAGGMAELYLAKQSGMEGFEKVVVIKRILSHLATDQEFVSMFLDEARIAAKLSHPNVVQIYDLGRADDTYYIAMEYVSGRNVAHITKKARDGGQSLPVEHAARIMAGVCDGLYYAHTRKDYDGKPLNIVHRDISPQNILVSFAGGVKLVDFGIAKASTQLAQTRAGVLKGKYSYMSPEQVRGDKIDARSDIFAVGIVMYEMLTGQRPFERDNSLKTLKAIVQEKPLNPRDLNPGVPAEIVKILSKSLEKDPNRRYANAQEMQLALEDWLDRSPVKSNNVRISRYLYDLFDDELNAEGGTLEVKGIGEIIIPTGSAETPAPPGGGEEIPEGTLRAALDDVEAAHDKKVAERAAKAAAVVAEVPVSDDTEAPESSEDNDPTRAVAAPPPPPGRGASSVVAARPPTGADEATDPSLASDGEEEGGATDELDGATIPVYDLQAYEAERLKRHEEGGPVRPERSTVSVVRDESSMSGDDAGFGDDQPTMNMDASARAALLGQMKKPGGAAGAAPEKKAESQKGAPAARENRVSPPKDPPKAPPPPPAREVARAAPPPPVDDPPETTLPPEPGPSTMDDEVVPGLAGGPVRPAAPSSSPASSHAGTEQSAIKLPLAAARGAPGRSAVALNPVQERVNLRDAAVSIPVPGMGAAPPANGAAALPEVPPSTAEAPAPPPPPKAPLTPEERARRQRVLVLVGATVFGLVVAVVVVAGIMSDGGGATATKDPPPDSAPVELGKITVKSTPPGCEFFIGGFKQPDMVTPARVEAKVGHTTVRVDCKGYQGESKEIDVVKDKLVEITFTPKKK
ncbi:MAG: serine/threonine protein kinase [Deltaproteobacteria bacterium]|nr:serine/threonine protein kinase [Deltaproteobacteria bacterium]